MTDNWQMTTHWLPTLLPSDCLVTTWWLPGWLPSDCPETTSQLLDSCQIYKVLPILHQTSSNKTCTTTKNPFLEACSKNIWNSLKFNFRKDLVPCWAIDLPSCTGKRRQFSFSFSNDYAGMLMEPHNSAPLMMKFWREKVNREKGTEYKLGQ